MQMSSTQSFPNVPVSESVLDALSVSNDPRAAATLVATNSFVKIFSMPFWASANHCVSRAKREEKKRVVKLD